MGKSLMFDTAELEALHAATHNLTPPPEHYSAFMTAFEKLNLELVRRKFRDNLVPASENPYQAMERIGKETERQITRRVRLRRER